MEKKRGIGRPGFRPRAFLVLGKGETRLRLGVDGILVLRARTKEIERKETKELLQKGPSSRSQEQPTKQGVGGGVKKVSSATPTGGKKNSIAGPGERRGGKKTLTSTTPP